MVRIVSANVTVVATDMSGINTVTRECSAYVKLYKIIFVYFTLNTTSILILFLSLHCIVLMVMLLLSLLLLFLLLSLIFLFL